MQRHLRTLAGAIIAIGSLSIGAQAQTPPDGRLLASNCFQCHGTNGKGPGFDKLAGKSASERWTQDNFDQMNTWFKALMADSFA